MTAIGLNHYLALSAIVFACGVLAVLLKRNAIGILIGVELVLNAATINLVAVNRYAPAGVAPTSPATGVTAAAAAAAAHPPLDGQVFALFVIVIAAAEAAVALAIFLNFYNHFASVDVERGKELKG